jgi:Zn-dependent protease/CBS domain-containing protein
MRSFTVGHVYGIPIRLHLTLLLILPLLAWLIGGQVGLWVENLNGLWGTALDPAPLTAGSTPLFLGVVAAVGLFLGVLLHELGHSMVALHYGYPIDSITLWILGGIAQFTEQPERWQEEFNIAIAGPLVSIALGVLSYAALVGLSGSLDTVRFVVGYLALMNFALAAFNMLPGFPMDGGRVLRALLARNRPYARATQIAAEVGKLFALVLALVGLFANIFLLLIALFIYVGASGEAQRTMMSAAFADVSVREIMTPAADLETAAADDTVAELIGQMFRQRHTGYPVVDRGDLVGLVTLDDARSVDEVERDAYRVEDVMSRDLITVPADSSVMDAFDTMQANGVGRVLVLEDGELAGLLTRTDVMTALNIIRDAGQSSRAPSVDRDDVPRPAR